MILVDTGPIVALFDPRDDAHAEARALLRTGGGPALTTVPVLTEAFHLLDPASRGSQALREFIAARGFVPWYLGDASLSRAMELMAQYADHPMDLADASLVAAAEATRCTTIFTLDRGDFSTYRARVGRSLQGFRIHV